MLFLSIRKIVELLPEKGTGGNNRKTNHHFFVLWGFPGVPHFQLWFLQRGTALVLSVRDVGSTRREWHAIPRRHGICHHPTQATIPTPRTKRTTPHPSTPPPPGGGGHPNTGHHHDHLILKLYLLYLLIIIVISIILIHYSTRRRNPTRTSFNTPTTT